LNFDSGGLFQSNLLEIVLISILRHEADALPTGEASTPATHAAVKDWYSHGQICSANVMRIQFLNFRPRIVVATPSVNIQTCYPATVMSRKMDEAVQIDGMPDGAIVIQELKARFLNPRYDKSATVPVACDT
jgi:hypothetical protein